MAGWLMVLYWGKLFARMDSSEFRGGRLVTETGGGVLGAFAGASRLMCLSSVANDSGFSLNGLAVLYSL